MGLFNFLKSKDLSNHLYNDEKDVARKLFGFIERIRQEINKMASEEEKTYDDYIKNIKYSNEKFEKFVRLFINPNIYYYDESTGIMHDLEMQLNILGNEVFNCSLKRANKQPVSIMNFVDFHNKIIRDNELLGLIPLRKATGDVLNHLCKRADVVLKDSLTLQEIESSVLMIILENTNKI